MGQYFINGADVNNLNQDFWYRCQQAIATFPFDVYINSGYRSLTYQEELKELYPNLANNPLESAHNFGLAIDVTPSPKNDENYIYMKNAFPNFGIRGISSERWHFQDMSWDREYMKQILYNNRYLLMIITIISTILILIAKYGKVLK